MARRQSAVTSAFRVQFVYDEDGSLETPEGKPLPGTRADYRKNPISALIDPKADPETGARREIPYEEYCRYYGNPDRHVVVGCIVEKRCGTCGAYSSAESLWNIDLMDDDPSYLAVQLDHWYTPEEAIALPGYLGEVAKDLLSETPWTDTNKPATRAEVEGGV
jgi:hypothetical protein